MSWENKEEYMKKLVTFIQKKIKESYDRILWYFYGKRWMREYDEKQQKERNEEEKALQKYYAELDKEKARWQKEADELRREQCEDDVERRRVEEDSYARLQAFWDALEDEGQETVEDFSDRPVYREDDEKPMPPEYEYWFTRCSKCGQYPEFCPCDGKFED